MRVTESQRVLSGMGLPSSWPTKGLCGYRCCDACEVTGVVMHPSRLEAMPHAPCRGLSASLEATQGATLIHTCSWQDQHSIDP